MIASKNSFSQIGLFEAQHTARAAQNALSAGQAAAVADGFAQQSVVANINVGRTAVGANSTLHAASGLGHYLALGQVFLFLGLRLEKAFKHIPLLSFVRAGL